VEEFVNRYQLILILLVLFFLWRLIFPLVLILFQLFTGLTF